MERNRIEVIWIWTKRIFPITAGAVLGYAYYHYIGCNGSCPISGNPYVSTIYGAFAGGLFVDWKAVFNKNKNSEQMKENN